VDDLDIVRGIKSSSRHNFERKCAYLLQVQQPRRAKEEEKRIVFRRATHKAGWICVECVQLDGFVSETINKKRGHGPDRGPVWPRQRIPIYR